MKTFFYNVKKETGIIDYDELEKIAVKNNPKIIICGGSAYSQDWDYKKFREIADKTNSLLMADIAHPAGLIATGLLTTKHIVIF